MDRLARLVRRGTPNSNRAATSAAGAPDEPVRSVLDLGSTAVRAVILSKVEPPAVLAFASESLPPRADDATVVRAAERALVRAEDGAGEVPRGVVVGVGAADCAFAGSLKEAKLALSAERGSAPDLTTLRSGVFGVSASIERLRNLIAALDLDLVGLVGEPEALAQLVTDEVGAVVIDVGGAATGVSVCRAGGVVASLSLPIGGEALEERLRDGLRLGVQEAREAAAAHSAGAGHRSSAGRSGSRTIAELAHHHADVWLDALETGLGELARGHSLPSKLLLCGGGSRLPELREGLEGEAWCSALPFDDAPVVRVLGAQDVKTLAMPRELALGPDAVTALCLALAAVRV